MQTDFYQRIGIVCREIPAGKVATYGQIALLCGKPRNSRQVGYGLKHGLAGRDVPAYKVVNAKGILSGAIYFDTYDMQRTLLEADGIGVTRTPEGFRVDLECFGWKNTLEDAKRLDEKFRLLYG
ncbi:MAG: MGMT family protein [Lachnospiraceae bacterium]|jgi:methylated-DNA-protein-cysteine methyltransferase-like protein|nr:MGMT family protein [Lachnospiraceae bacterium]NBJ81716.1 MGMT family protein [bacterium 1XD42-76]NBK05160.1 MGMT family protein [bacterium 1XD42-94]